jgi:hypothetical protein
MNNEMKGYGRKRLWPNLRHYSGIFLEGLKKTTKILGQDSGLRAETSIQIIPNPKHECLPLCCDVRSYCELLRAEVVMLSSQLQPHISLEELTGQDVAAITLWNCIREFTASNLLV